MPPGLSHLLPWYLRHRRDLPWRNTSDPYKIWISEVMLQQTRAQAVIPYYLRFLERFPTVETLASASERAVLHCWSGLGYYSRARNLRKAARQIVGLGGFPRDYDGIRALPGVGDYTAAAVASIAFGLPHAVLDGNVMRVIARIAGDAGDIGAGVTRKRFAGIADGLLDRAHPGQFNQAMMELGATICLPRAPLCLACPVAASCAAYARGIQNELPVKLRRLVPERIDSTLIVVRRRGSILFWQRGADASRMAGFWELPSAEDLPLAQPGAHLGIFRHSITHHRYTISVVEAEPPSRIPKRFQWIGKSRLPRIPLSTITRKALAIASRHL